MGLALGLLIGIAIGVISGLIPVLTYFYGMSQHRAQGTSLATLLLPIGFFAFWEYHKAGNVDLKLAVMLALGFAAGAYFGGAWAQSIPDSTLRKGFAVLLAVLAIKMFIQK